MGNLKAKIRVVDPTCIGYNGEDEEVKKFFELLWKMFTNKEYILFD